MAKIIPISEHFQHFLAEMKESFWGDLYGQTKLAWQRFFELQSERQRDRYSGWGRYERRRGRRRVYRNGYYERDFVTRFGTIRLRVARTREKSFLPRGLQPFQRRWQASLAGVSAQSGRESGRLGRLAPGSVSPRAGRQAPGADRHGWLCGFGGGDSDGVSAGTTSALLGA